MCEAGACGSAEAVNFCYLSHEVGSTKSLATCICNNNYDLNAATRQCVAAPTDRCATEAPCGPLEGVNSCKEHPLTGKFRCTCRSGYVLNARNNKCEKKCNEDEASLCGNDDAHDKDRCSVGDSGRVCTCNDGFALDPSTNKCKSEPCYRLSCGWFEGVSSCSVEGDRHVCQCADTFQLYQSGECLPQCLSGFRYNRNRESCESARPSCLLTACGPEEAVDACLVDKDSGVQICKCKAGYGLDAATGLCAQLPECAKNPCKAFGDSAVCVSNGNGTFACQCISHFPTVGAESTPVVSRCAPVECEDLSVCGDDPEGVLECQHTATGPLCRCSASHSPDQLSGLCVRNENAPWGKNQVPLGSLRASATRAPLKFTINAGPCISASFDLVQRIFEAKTYQAVS